MSNNMKFLLLNITLLAGMYCNCEYSRCAGCCKNCCGNGEEDSKNENENKILDNNNNQLLKQDNVSSNQENLSDNNDNDTNNNEGNNVKNGEGGNNNENNNNKGNEEEKNENKEINDEINEDEAKNQQVFKIEEVAIDNNNLGCFGNKWFEEYQKKKNDNNKDTILLYKLTEQKNKEKEAGILVYSKGSKNLKYTNGGSFPNDLKDSDNKWAIFKVTTLNKDNKATPGESHIFYCSDVSSIVNDGLFKQVRCYSIEILAAQTTEVKNFHSMFYDTKSSLEKDNEQQDKPGFIGLEELDLSSADRLSYMFYKALFKQKTINSLGGLRLRDKAYISYMFYVDTDDFGGKNCPNFSVLNGWIVENNGYLKYLFGSKYNIFFKGDDDAQNNDKLPEWYENNIKKL